MSGTTWKCLSTAPKPPPGLTTTYSRIRGESRKATPPLLPLIGVWRGVIDLRSLMNQLRGRGLASHIIKVGIIIVLIIGDYYYLSMSSWGRPGCLRCLSHLDDPVDRRGEVMRFNQASIRPCLRAVLFISFSVSPSPCVYGGTLALSGGHCIPLPRD